MNRFILLFFKRINIIPSLKIASIYFFVSALYIFFSDKILLLIYNDLHKLTQIQTVKGWVFVLFSALLIFVLSRYEIRKKNLLIQLLNDKNNWYNLLTSNLPGVNIYLFDHELYCILARGPDAEKLKNTRKNIIGRSLQEIEFKNIFSQQTRRIIDYVIEFKPFKEEFKSKQRVYEIKGVPIPSVFGVVDGYILISYDLTEQKALITELTQSRNEYRELYKNYQEANEKLKFQNKQILKMNKELQISNEKALESDKMKSAFLANISHEIRTPMNAILGFSNFLNREGISIEEKEKYTRIIKVSVDQLLGIIDDLIELSRIEAGLIELKFSYFSVKDLSEELLIHLRESISSGRNEIDAILNYPDDYEHVMINTDRKRVLQIFMNLISNAVTHTEKGYIEIGFEGVKDGNAGFYIKDTGYGIPDSLIEKISSPFVKGEDQKFHRGIGIGLTIINGLIKSLKGNLEVFSEVNKGTTFRFDIPVQVNTEIKKIAQNEFNQLKGNVLLIVEDDEINYKLLHEILQPLNMILLHASTGNQAIDIFKRTRGVSVVLLDLKLPDISGFEVAKSIKEIDNEVPVIVQSAFVDDSTRNETTEIGCVDFLPKPIDREELLFSLQKYARVND